MARSLHCIGCDLYCPVLALTAECFADLFVQDVGVFNEVKNLRRAFVYCPVEQDYFLIKIRNWEEDNVKRS